MVNSATTLQTRYREIEVSGSPKEMGRQLGEAAQDEIRGFAEIALERVNKTSRVSTEHAMDVARRTVPYVHDYAPHLLEELEGTAEAADLSLDQLLMLQVRNQLQADGEEAGCTSFAIDPSAGAGAFVGQNWDNDPALNPFTIILTRRPTGKPALMNITQAGLIAYMGLNSKGIGVCLNTLPAPARPLGVPHYFTVRGIYEASTLDEAIEAVRSADRAISANIILITPQGPADLEVTIDDVHVIRDDAGLLTHTNHCEHPDLVPINDDFDNLIQSAERKVRIQRLFSEMDKPYALESLKAALSDHQDYPTSICRHPNEHPTTGYWSTAFSVIIDSRAGEMHVSRGNPCQHPYETYRLN